MTWIDERWLLGAALLSLALVAGCADEATDAMATADAALASDTGPDDAGMPTSLLGDTPCGDLTCGTGEVCVTRYSGADAGVGGAPVTPRCRALPTGCGELYDCAIAFPSSDVPDCCEAIHRCARELCGYPEPPACVAFSGGGIEVTGRMVECGGI